MTKEELQRLIKVEDREKSNTKRLNEHDMQIKELSNVYIALTKVNDKVDNVEKDVIEMKDDLKDIKNKPAKRWESIVDKIIFTILGIIIAYLFSKIGM